jgi:hypothetical protein
MGLTYCAEFRSTRFKVLAGDRADLGRIDSKCGDGLQTWGRFFSGKIDGLFRLARSNRRNGALLVGKECQVLQHRTRREQIWERSERLACCASVTEQSPIRNGERLHPARSTVIAAQPVVAGWRATAARFLCNAPSAPPRRAFLYRPGFEAVRGRPFLTSGLREQLLNQTKLR